jgi:hypothetical protein
MELVDLLSFPFGSWRRILGHKVYFKKKVIEVNVTKEAHNRAAALQQHSQVAHAIFEWWLAAGADLSSMTITKNKYKQFRAALISAIIREVDSENKLCMSEAKLNEKAFDSDWKTDTSRSKKVYSMTFSHFFRVVFEVRNMPAKFVNHILTF